MRSSDAAPDQNPIVTLAKPIWTTAAALLICGALAAPAAGAEPERSLSQFEHTAWTIRQGAPPDVWALAQSPDGYLWLGTGAGLYRFDGVRFDHVSAANAKLPADDITALLALPTGELWIGYQAGGVSVLKAGQVTSFTEGLPHGAISQFVMDQDGTLWAAAVGGGLARFRGGRWREVGPEMGFPQVPVYALQVAQDGALWVAAAANSLGKQSDATLMVLRRGAARFQIIPKRLDSPWTFARAPDGRTWLSDQKTGVHPLSDPPTAAAPNRSGLPPLTRMVFDRAGALWGVEKGAGVFRILQAGGGAPIVEHFSLKDGLSSDIAAIALEDREGDIWIGTNLGLDRFRPAQVIPEPVIPTTASEGYIAAKAPSGALYMTANRKLYRIAPGAQAQPLTGIDVGVQSMAAARDGTIWIGGDKGLMRYAQGRLSPAPLPAGAEAGLVMSCAEGPDGALWVIIKSRGLFRRGPAGWRRIDPPKSLAGAQAMQVTFDQAGEAWVSYENRTVLRLGRDGAQQTFAAKEGLDIGDLQILVPTKGGLMIGGDRGLARFDGKAMRSLSLDLAPDFERITGLAQTARGETWLNGIRGVIRLDTQALDQAFAHRRAPPYRVLDYRDGLPGLAQQNAYSSSIQETADHRLWLLTNHGVAWIDPSRLTRNPLPPPVAISALTADGRTYDPGKAITLPSGAVNLQIDFTALSLTNPERNQFRYRLEGVDSDWVDPGVRRQAFYTKLGPGDYRFRVIASNNDGVWNRVGASTDFTIRPAFYQTNTFYALGVGGVALLGWLLYHLRVQYISGQIRDKLEARLLERERIARELHDTLLQSLQGLMLRFRAVAGRLPPDHVARRELDLALLRAEETLVEGRERVQDLRAADAPQDLAAFFAVTAEKLAPDHAAKTRILAEGRARDLHPLIRDELARIGEEALFNAFRHANARTIEVGLIFGADRLTLRVCDDGKGIAEDLLDGDGPSGHFGLRGMRERAERIGASFALCSGAGLGTEVKVTVPAKVAYTTAGLFKTRIAFSPFLGMKP